MKKNINYSNNNIEFILNILNLKIWYNLQLR